MIKIAIIEDDQEYHNICHQLLLEYKKDNEIDFIIHDFYNGISFLDAYKDNFDLIIMDIEMPQMNGLEVSKQIRKIDKSVPIIIISHSSQYAINGYLINAFGYVLKPIQPYDFYYVIEKAINYITNQSKDFIVISSKSLLKKINVTDILYIEIDAHILNIVTINENISIRESIKKYEEILKKYNFVRCNNSYLVNLKYCESVDFKNNILKIYNCYIPISRSKKKLFLEELTKYIGKSI